MIIKNDVSHSLPGNIRARYNQMMNSLKLLCKWGVLLQLLIPSFSFADSLADGVKLAPVLENRDNHQFASQCLVDTYSKYIVSSHVDGAVQWLKEPGNELKEGEKVAAQDTYFLETEKRLIELAIEKLHHQKAHTKKQIARLSSLAHEGHGVISELDTFKYELRVIENELLQQKIRQEEVTRKILLSDHNAMFDSVVSQRFVEQGAYLKIGDPILELVSYKEKQIKCDIPVEFVGRIDAGTEIQVELNNQYYQAGLGRLLKWSSDNSQSFAAYIHPDISMSEQLVLGTRVEVKIKLVHQNSVLVPHDALLLEKTITQSEQKNQRYVLVKPKGKDTVSKANVTILASTPLHFIVEGDITSNDQVVVRGAAKLINNLNKLR